NVIIPISIIVFIGYIVQLRFQLDRPTLAKLTINYVMPAFIFVSLYESDIDFSLLLNVIFLLGIFAVVTFVITRAIGKFMGLDKGQRILFTNSNLFYNAGNYGVPVNDLVFKSDPFAMT